MDETSNENFPVMALVLAKNATYPYPELDLLRQSRPCPSSTQLPLLEPDEA